MGSIVQDVLHGFRRLRNSPGFATTAILTLALGIGATTAIFTLIYQVMLRSIPVDHPGGGSNYIRWAGRSSAASMEGCKATGASSRTISIARCGTRLLGLKAWQRARQVQLQ